MKLNIEELAREADLSPMTADSHCRVDYWTATKTELEIFASLIVERCAQECENISDEYQRREGFKYPEMKTDAQTGASECEAAIRNLLEG